MGEITQATPTAMGQQDKARAIAYAVLCHDQVQRVAAQFKYIWSPDSYYFYHVDQKAPEELAAFVLYLQSTYDNVFSVPSVLCSWAGFSLVEAMFGLIERAVQSGRDWSHLVFLSEHHLPVVSHRVISETLQPETSYVSCAQFSEFSEDEREDLTHRFDGEYRELPGVGAFRVKQREAVQQCLSQLWAGSQWMVLARPTCELLRQCMSNPFWDLFRTSLLPDETAIQTWIQGNGSKTCRNIRRNMTFVAFPGLGGTSDMTFSETNFFSAIQDGYLFIRKRPGTLPSSVEDYLNRIIPSSATIQFPELEGLAVKSRRRHPPCLADVIRFSLNEILKLANADVVVLAMPQHVVGPAFFCITEARVQDPAISIFVLSSDMCSFKVTAVHNHTSHDLATSTLGPYETTLLKVRAHDVAFHREIHLGDDLSSGFADVTSMAGLARLALLIQRFVHRAQKLAWL